LQQTKARKMEAQERIGESFEIKGIKMHLKQPELVKIPSVSITREVRKQKKNELIRKVDSLKKAISALIPMLEDIQQRCSQESQSSSTATNQPQQRHTGKTNNCR